MMQRTWVCIGIAWGLLLGTAASAAAQSSSLYRSQLRSEPKSAKGSAPAREVWAVGQKIDPVPPSTRTLERHSLVAVVQNRPRPIQVHDLITIIVREQKKYESDSEVETDKKWKLDGELSQWFRFFPGHKMGADNLTNGNPGVRLQWQNKYETEGQADREDKFVTRVTGQIIDVKPNGNVVVEARKYEKHDDEEITVTLTGVCRAKDITPDNTVLSTQIHDLVITESHTGAVRDATRRGWIPRLLDLLRPF
jgi:flagellar L-ring protein precursor FlgH